MPYRSIFSAFYWPYYPGFSGGEIRDFHLAQYLGSISKLCFIASHQNLAHGRADRLLAAVDERHLPPAPNQARPTAAAYRPAKLPFHHRIARYLRRRMLPVVGPRYHGAVADMLPQIEAFARPKLQALLAQSPPDFLFVSPQINPVALNLKTRHLPTRLVLASYDVEAVRMRRVAQSERGVRRLALALEARRAARFEQENLARFDGVIAVSPVDKRIFVEQYGFAPDRVWVTENGVDPAYFAFSERPKCDAPTIVFAGNMPYLPNQQAAQRLVQSILPRVRRRYPDARLWIVGQYPPPQLLAQADNRHIFVTGKVDDVRPYLAQATVACIPLVSGAGTKYKVLEALSAGVPVVCTRLALEGLNLEDGRHVLLADGNDELAAAIVKLFEQPQLAAELAHNGRDAIECHYAWQRVLSPLEGWLKNLTKRPVDL